MSTRTRVVALAVTGALAATALGACTSSSTSTSTSSSTIAGAQPITIGISDDEPGLALKEGSGYSGFDIAVASYVAGKLGRNPVYKVIKQADRETALESGEVDLVVDTYSITAERKAKVDFAGPYFVAHQDLLVRRNDETLTGPTKLDGRTLCSVTGTTSAAYVKEKYLGKITLREVPTFSECVRNLVAGDVDAVTTDDLILAGFAATPEYKGVLKLIGKGFTDERYGVGLKKGSDLTPKVTAALKTFISDGSWAKALDTYVAPSGYAIPSPPTVDS